jgi:arylsulfatase A-like enzyme
MPEKTNGIMKYNVINIICDQLPYYALGCYGHRQVKTPNIDSLAQKGVLFENAFSQSPVCVPARASQLTGLYPSNHGLFDNCANLDIIHPFARFLTDKFHEEGYATANFGKWHCGKRWKDLKFTEFKFIEESVVIWPQSELKRFEQNDSDQLYFGGILHAGTHPYSQDKTGPAKMTDDSIDFMKRFVDKPFFMRVPFLGPHSPVLVPKPFDTMYDPADIELSDFDLDEIANRPKVIRDFQENCIAKRSETPDGISPEDAIRKHIAYTLGLISHIDDQIGRILRKVTELGLEEKTLVVFTTDHGGFWGEHQFLEKNYMTLYRNLFQIPLIMSLPGTVPQGKTVHGFVEGVDIMPTLMDFAGIKNEYRINGQSMRAAVLGDETSTRKEVFAESHGEYYVASLRDENWNFIWHSAPNEAELYDMRTDPHERFNLGGKPEYKEVVEEMKTRLLSRLMNNRDVHLMPDDENLTRSPIELMPGMDENAQLQKLIREFRE